MYDIRDKSMYILLEAIYSEMSKQEHLEAMFKDPLTGAYNRRAFELITEPEDYVAIIDLDSLKYFNDAVQYGHRVGDALLQHLVNIIKSTGLEVFRLGGSSDEFAVCNKDNKLLLHLLLNEARALFPGFSFGIGKDLAEADKNLYKNKQSREKNGARSPRGIAPPWLFMVELDKIA